MADSNGMSFDEAICLISTLNPSNLLNNNAQSNYKAPSISQIEVAVNSIEKWVSELEFSRDDFRFIQVSKLLLVISAALANFQGTLSPPKIPYWIVEGHLPGEDRDICRLVLSLVDAIGIGIKTSENVVDLLLILSDILSFDDSNTPKTWRLCFHWARSCIFQSLVSRAGGAHQNTKSNAKSVQKFKDVLFGRLWDIMTHASQSSNEDNCMWWRAIGHSALSAVIGGASLISLKGFITKDNIETLNEFEFSPILAYLEPKLIVGDDVKDLFDDGTGRIPVQDHISVVFSKQPPIKSICAAAVWCDDISKKLAGEALTAIVKQSAFYFDNVDDDVVQYLDKRLIGWLLGLRSREKRQRENRMAGWKTDQGAGNRFVLATLIRRVGGISWRDSGDAIGNAIPLTLSLMDDFELEHQTLGLDLLLRIMRCATPTTVSIHSDLLYQALSRAISAIRLPDDRPQLHQLGCCGLFLAFTTQIKLLSLLPSDSRRHTLLDGALDRITRARGDAEVIAVVTAIPSLLRQLRDGLELISHAKALVEVLGACVQERGLACQECALVAIGWALPGMWPVVKNHCDHLLAMCFQVALTAMSTSGNLQLKELSLNVASLVVVLAGPVGCHDSLNTAKRSLLLLPICDEVVQRQSQWKFNTKSSNK